MSPRQYTPEPKNSPGTGGERCRRAAARRPLTRITSRANGRRGAQHDEQADSRLDAAGMRRHLPRLPHVGGAQADRSRGRQRTGEGPDGRQHGRLARDLGGGPQPMRRVAQRRSDEPCTDGAARALPATRADLRHRPRYPAAVQDPQRREPDRPLGHRRVRALRLGQHAAEAEGGTSRPSTTSCPRATRRPTTATTPQRRLPNSRQCRLDQAGMGRVILGSHHDTRKPAGLRSNGQGSRQRTRGPCPSTIQPRNASDPNPPETAVWGRRAWRDRPGTPACAGSDRCPARAT